MTTLLARSSFDPALIIETVGNYYHTSMALIKSAGRQRSIVLPRHVAMHLLRKHSNLSCEQIGEMFGKRDHSTVVHADRTTLVSIEQDAIFAAQVEAIEETLRLATDSVTPSPLPQGEREGSAR